MTSRKNCLCVGLLSCAFTLLGACATEGESMLVIGDICDGSCAPPSNAFVLPDAGDDASEVQPQGSEKVLACVGTECPYPYATCPAPDGLIVYKCQTNLLTDNDNC